MKKADNSKNMLQRKKQRQIERQKWGKKNKSYNKSVHLTRKYIGLNFIRLFAAQSSIRRSGDFRVRLCGSKCWNAKKGEFMIKLEDFVSETIKQVISGVRIAQEYAKENNAKVNPRGLTFRTDQGEVRFWHAASGQVAQDLDFDVAVTTVEGTATKGGIGVFVGPVGLGSQGQSHGINTSESRIKFKVPILLPLQE